MITRWTKRAAVIAGIGCATLILGATGAGASEPRATEGTSSTTTATSLRKPDSSALNCAKAAKKVGLGSGERRVILVAISMAESHCDNRAIGGPNSNGSYDRGAWQINDIHGYNKSKLTSSITYNAKAARTIYSQQGLGAWAAYNNGSYKQFMSTARKAVNRA